MWSSLKKKFYNTDNVNMISCKLTSAYKNVLPHKMRKGFTLAELLVALGILGVIATFTIPKVLSSSKNSQYKAMAKEFAATISQAYYAYKLDNRANASTKINDFATSLNYVNVDTSRVVDNSPLFGTIDCGSGTETCLKLHNGAMVIFDSNENFSGTTNDNGIIVNFDPDGKASDIKAASFILRFSGKFEEQTDVPNGTVVTSRYSGVTSGNPTDKPDWFNWS